MIVLPKQLRSVEALAFLGGGRLLVTGNETRKMPVWDLDDPTRPAHVLTNGEGRTPILVPLPADDLLLVGDDQLTVVNAATGEIGSTVAEGDGYRAVVAVAVHPPTRRMAFVNAHQMDGQPIGSLFRYDATFNPKFVKHLPPGQTGRLCRACAFDAPGRRLFVASDDPSQPGSSRILHVPVQRNTKPRYWLCPLPVVEQLVVDPVAGHLAARGRGGVSIYPDGDWNWPPLRLVELGQHKVTGLAFHPSGRRLAVTSTDETVKLFGTAPWKLETTFTWAIGRMRSVAFSPDGALAAAGSDTGQVVVWDVDV